MVLEPLLDGSLEFLELRHSVQVVSVQMSIPKISEAARQTAETWSTLYAARCVNRRFHRRRLNRVVR